MLQVRKLACMLAAAAGLALPGGSPASAQDAAAGFPSRPISLVVPYVPGGFPDTVARIVAGHIEEKLGKNVLVENKPGAGGIIAVDSVLNAPPDGHTILMADPQHWAISPLTLKNVTYDPLKDFAGVSLVANTANFLFVRADFAAKDFKEFLAMAKAEPDKYSYGTPGIGSIHHLTMEMLKAQTGMKLLHVPYKGGGQLLPAVLGGELPVALQALGALAGSVAEGKVRLLGVAGEQRSELAPNVPTFREVGVNLDFPFTGIGIVASSKTPPAIVEKLSQAVRAATAHPDTIERMKKLNISPLGTTPAQTQEMLRAEYAKFKTAVDAIGLTPQ